MADVTADLARRAWRALEAVHGIVYFVPEAEEEYVAAGLEPGRMGYFASRSAAMGPVPADVVIATFFNFEPGLVRSVIPRAWSLASPADVLAARLRAVDRSLRRLLGDDVVASDEVAEAAGLTRAAAGACRPPGRPLYAGHATLPWPEEPHLVLWHAQTLLREFRGDAHVAALVAAGVGPLTALVLHAGTGQVPAAALVATRQWPQADWDAEVARLQALGWLDDAALLAGEGAALRAEVEAQTDRASLEPYATIGVDGCERLRAIGKQLTATITAAGGLPIPRR